MGRKRESRGKGSCRGQASEVRVEDRPPRKTHCVTEGGAAHPRDTDVPAVPKAPPAPPLFQKCFSCFLSECSFKEPSLCLGEWEVSFLVFYFIKGIRSFPCWRG